LKIDVSLAEIAASKEGAILALPKLHGGAAAGTGGVYACTADIRTHPIFTDSKEQPAAVAAPALAVVAFRVATATDELPKLSGARPQ
jgi:hypothetical protein